MPNILYRKLIGNVHSNFRNTLFIMLILSDQLCACDIFLYVRTAESVRKVKTINFISITVVNVRERLCIHILYRYNKHIALCLSTFIVVMMIIKVYSSSHRPFILVWQFGIYYVSCSCEIMLIVSEAMGAHNIFRFEKPTNMSTTYQVSTFSILRRYPHYGIVTYIITLNKRSVRFLVYRCYFFIYSVLIYYITHIFIHKLPIYFLINLECT